MIRTICVANAGPGVPTLDVPPEGRKLMRGFQHLSDDYIRHGIPRVPMDCFMTMLKSILVTLSAMKPYKPGEAIFGVYKAWRSQSAEKVNAQLVEMEMSEVQRVGYWIIWARAAYRKDKSLAARKIGIGLECIIDHRPTPRPYRPGYLIGVDHSKKAIVLSIKGTTALSDWATNLTCHSGYLNGIKVHTGFLIAAGWIVDTTYGTIRKQMDHTGYALVLTGHSLGAAVAALATMIFRENNFLGVNSKNVTCYNYSCPPCVDKNSSPKTYISSMINRDDIVTRLSAKAIDNLRGESQQAKWQGNADAWQVKMLTKMEKYFENVVSTGKSLATDTVRKGWEKAEKGDLGQACQDIAAQVNETGTRFSEFLYDVEGKARGKAPEKLHKSATVIAEKNERLKDMQLVDFIIPGTLYHFTCNSGSEDNCTSASATQVARILLGHMSIFDHTAKSMHRAISKRVPLRYCEKEEAEEAREELRGFKDDFQHQCGEKKAQDMLDRHSCRNGVDAAQDELAPFLGTFLKDFDTWLEEIGEKDENFKENGTEAEKAEETAERESAMIWRKARVARFNDFGSKVAVGYAQYQDQLRADQKEAQINGEAPVMQQVCLKTQRFSSLVANFAANAYELVKDAEPEENEKGISSGRRGFRKTRNTLGKGLAVSSGLTAELLSDIAEHLGQKLRGKDRC